MIKHLVVIALVLGAGYKYWHDRPAPIEFNVRADFPPAAARLSVERKPFQRTINPNGRAYQHQEYLITPLADFQFEARVLSAASYGSDRESSLSPVDLALGWGPMADPAVIDRIEISQSGRWYNWHVDQWHVSRETIEHHSANMHFIPGNAAVAARLDEVEAGDVVRLRGYLVEVNADDGWRWVSSMTREDTGTGGCEVVLVDDLVRL